MPGPRSAAVLTALLLHAPIAFAADPRAAFHASKTWVDFASAGVVVREQWLAAEGTALTLVHAVRTSPAEPKLEGAVFAVDTQTGDEWSGTIESDACPPLHTVRSMTALYRQGGVVVVRLGQGAAVRKPFAACGDLYRAGDLAACTLRVPIKPEAITIASGPAQLQYGPGWISATKGRVDVARSPPSGMRLTSWLRECLGDELPVLALLEDRLALAGPRHMLLVSPELTAVCTSCPEAGLPAPVTQLAGKELEKRVRSAKDAWRSGRREQALSLWGALFEAWWVGDKVPTPAWLQAVTDYGVALKAAKQWDQARQVLEEGWTMSKFPSAELLLAMGDVYGELGEADAATRAYERVLEVAPTRPQRDRAVAELKKRGR